MDSVSALKKRYTQAQRANLSLDMSRGKPCPAQLDLSAPLLEPACIQPPFSESGFDCRNYGLIEGLPEARRLFAELLAVPPEQVLVCGNASLQILFDTLADFMLFGTGGHKPWLGQDIRFLCPVPGYDRHFQILQHFGITMLPIPLRSDGPDMAAVVEAVQDPRVKGMVCVPKYSNPEGRTFTSPIVEALASIQTAAPDFRVFWDNAYWVHDLYEQTIPLANVFEAAARHGTQDRFIAVASFSKISFAGGGISAVAASPANLARIRERMDVQLISFDKLNQLRHVRFFGNAAGVHAHMQKHAAILRPKFEAVLHIFEQELSSFAQWTRPRGGYFISLNLPHGTAKRTWQLCHTAGVTLTPPGATYPYGIDPHDHNLRIAPTFPSLTDLKQAAHLLCLCAQIAVATQ